MDSALPYSVGVMLARNFVDNVLQLVTPRGAAVENVQADSNFV